MDGRECARAAGHRGLRRPLALLLPLLATFAPPVDAASWRQGPAGPLLMRPRGGMAMAFHETLGTTVMYGGTSPAQTTVTYELDGAGWRETEPGPPALGSRFGHAMAYDTARARVVLFGGVGTTDTWEFDGATWLAGGSAPAALTARRGMAFAYHAGIARTVLFGGDDGDVQNDTWLYDGTSWLPGPSAPPAMVARSGTAMAYHAVLGRLVLFGGGTDGSPPSSWLDDTWEMAGASWSPGPPAPVALLPRALHQMAYDAGRGRIVMYGGPMEGTWEYDGSWQAGVSPPAPMLTRTHHAMAYDALRGVVVVHGGYYWPQPPLMHDDTWEYDGLVWRRGPPPGPGIADREHHAMAYDAARDRVVLFGGQSVTEIRTWQHGDTWEFDGVDWRAGPGAPGGLVARYGHAMAYDAARARVVLFGGLDDAYNLLSDTWELDGTAWTQGPVPPAALTGRAFHAMAHDRVRARSVLFGGWDGAPRDDTWEYDGSAWSAGAPAPPALAPRNRHAMAFDDAMDRVVLVGGTASGTPLPDTWLYDGLAWSAGPALPPALEARFDAALAFDPALGRCVLFGGNGASAPLGDAWELDASGWSAGAPAPASLWPRAKAAMAPSATGLVLFGGASPPYCTRNDTWIYDSCLIVAPPALPDGGFGVPYAATLTATGGTPPYTFSVSAGTLPPGLALAATGALSGTPSMAGTFAFAVKAEDATGCTGGRAYVVRIDCPGVDVTVLPATLPPATAGTGYSQQIVATGGSSPHTFAVAQGAPPSGIVLDATGLLAGTPLLPGTSSFTVEATDAVGCTGSRAYQIDVDCPVIVVTPASLPDGGVSEAYVATLGASGGSGTYAFQLSSGALPPGLTLQSDGSLTGTPTTAGMSPFVVVVADLTTGCTETAPYEILILAVTDIVVGEGLGPPNANRVRVFDAGGGPAPVDIDAYAAGGWGVNVAAGEIDRDGHDEIVTGPGPGQNFGPQLRAFRATGAPVAKVNLFAFGTLRYGVNPSSADVDGDGYDELLAGAGPGEPFGPHVRGFGYDGAVVAPIAGINFFAYSTLRFGANVARGDVDADAIDEILTGPGPSALFAAHVRGFDHDGGATTKAIPTLSFIAYAAFRHGVVVAGDGDATIACAPGPGPSLPARLLGFSHGASGVAALPGFDVIAFPTLHGGRVGLAPLSGTPAAEMLAGAGRDPAASSAVETYAYDGNTLSLLPNGFTPFASAYGVNVSGGREGY